MRKAVRGFVLPDGRGLFPVLFIRASILLSWSWLSEDDPEASRKTAATGKRIDQDNPSAARIKPVAVERVTRKETLGLIKSQNI
jgi:hypothetical protein